MNRTGAWRGIALATLVVAASAVDAGLFDRLFAPKARLWPRWSEHQAGAVARIDHAAWDALLRKHVTAHRDGINRVDYGALDAADRRALAAYIERLEATPVTALERDEQRAFWINLYNAVTLREVLEHYPVDSIREIRLSGWPFAAGPWSAKLVSVQGERLSLNDIEHRILRPIWGDPRIHYAVNCAALGCPNLQAVAFTAGNAESLLDAGARAYVNHPRGVRFEGEALVVSSIYVWFEEDFLAADGSVLAHLLRFAEPALAARLARARRISGNAYDWSLNDAGVPSVPVPSR